jgi:hypothetical protein
MTGDYHMYKPNCKLADLGKEYKIIKNLVLPNKYTKTTQLDHIIISIYGIFVVELRNYKGHISGEFNDKIWIQKTHKIQKEFKNPLHKNYKHIKAVEEYTGIDIKKIFSIVFFSGDSVFDNKMPKNVIDKNLVSYIKSFRKSILSDDDVRNAYNALKRNEVLFSKDNSNVKEFCPKCGAELLMRKSRLGLEFLGCSTFPKCKYTRKL